MSKIKKEPVGPGLTLLKGRHSDGSKFETYEGCWGSFTSSGMARVDRTIYRCWENGKKEIEVHYVKGRERPFTAFMRKYPDGRRFRNIPPEIDMDFVFYPWDIERLSKYMSADSMECLKLLLSRESRLSR